MEDLARKRDAILEKWLEQTLASYPSQTAGFLRNVKATSRAPPWDLPAWRAATSAPM